MLNEPTVFVVDDDKGTRESIGALVRSMGLDAKLFCSAEEFLEAYLPGCAGCLVTDVRMLGMSGLELQETMIERGICLPVVVLTAYARTPLTVRAMEHGAVTVLEKPYEDDDLWGAVRKALTRDTAGRAKQSRKNELRSRIEKLTPAQREVMQKMITGKANKVVAGELGVSVRTVEHRRSQVLAIMEVDSVVELVRLVIEADLE